MARNTDILLNSETPTELTNADVTRFSTQNKTPHTMSVLATNGSVPLVTDTGAYDLPPFGAFVDEEISGLWGGVPGAVRIFAWLNSGTGMAMISHG